MFGCVVHHLCAWHPLVRKRQNVHYAFPYVASCPLRTTGPTQIRRKRPLPVPYLCQGLVYSFTRGRLANNILAYTSAVVFAEKWGVSDMKVDCIHACLVMSFYDSRDSQ